MKTIQSMGVTKATVSIPGSKSYTHRALVAAALADGHSVIENGLFCEDTYYTMTALKKLGAVIDHVDHHFSVRGVGGKPSKCSACETEKASRYEWANLTGEYTNPYDYIRLCKSCHIKFDKRRKKRCR